MMFEMNLQLFGGGGSSSGLGGGGGGERDENGDKTYYYMFTRQDGTREQRKIKAKNKWKANKKANAIEENEGYKSVSKGYTRKEAEKIKRRRQREREARGNN